MPGETPEIGTRRLTAADERLASRIVADMAACGVVGESTQPDGGLPGGGIAQTGQAALAVLIQSSSAAEVQLTDAALNLIPPEERLQYSAMTWAEPVLDLGETNLQHKILAIARKKVCARQRMRSSCCSRTGN
ncbi:hypothetical protein ACVXG8_01095 [Escherichia coli]